MSFIVKQRQKARFYAIQAVYQNHFFYLEPNILYQEFYNYNSKRQTVDWPFFSLLIHGVDLQQDLILHKIKDLIQSPIEQINLVNLSIIKLGIYELLFCSDIPKAVVISEYVKQAYNLGTDKGYMFVNGVLENLSTTLPV